jgi:hypothetical protein
MPLPRWQARTAPPQRHAGGGRPGALLPGGPDRLRGAAGTEPVAGVLQHPAPGRGAALGGPCARAGQPCGARRVPAHGWRIRRQGNAGRPHGGVGRHCRPQAALPGQAAFGPGRRLHGHRQAASVLVRIHRGFRRRRPAAGPATGDGRQLRLQCRPQRPGGRPGGVPQRQRLFPGRRRHRVLPLQDEHPEPHRVSRLRRAAGRDPDRNHPGRRRPCPRSRPARRAPAQPVWRGHTQCHALPDEGRGQHPRPADHAAGAQRALPASARPRSRAGMRPAR